jgi:glycosyltransferase involved in cell wall biosynthesis
MPEVRISVVINTLNEERHLAYALRSVQPWADEIVVVDMHSQDRTVEIAREFGTKVYFHEPTGFVEPARSFAVAQATGDWILILDADEMVPLPLSLRLREIAHRDEADVIALPRLNYLLGGPLMHTGWGPHQDVHMRFFKRGCLRMSAEIHSLLRPVSGSRVVTVSYQPGYAVVHFNYLDCSHFLEKLNRYTSVEAQQAYDRGEHAATFKALTRAGREFLFRYVRAKGYRDGWRGFSLSVFMAFYRIAACAKLKELEDASAREAVERFYRCNAEHVLAEYATVKAGK